MSNALAAESVRFAIRAFYRIMILFYLLWSMFHDESSSPTAIKFEAAVMMIAVAMLFNVGFSFSLGSIGPKLKKITVSLLFMAAFFNFSMFASIVHSPFHLLVDAQWYALRKALAYGSVLFSLVISLFVLRFKNDS